MGLSYHVLCFIWKIVFSQGAENLYAKHQSSLTIQSLKCQRKMFVMEMLTCREVKRHKQVLLEPRVIIQSSCILTSSVTKKSQMVYEQHQNPQD